MANITIGKKTTVSPVVISILVALIAIGTAAYFVYDSAKKRDQLLGRVHGLEAEKLQMSQQIEQVNAELTAQQAKVDQLTNEVIEAKKERDMSEEGLKKKAEEIAKLQERYERRIVELEQDVKRYANFSEMLNKALEPIRESLAISGSNSLGVAADLARLPAHERVTSSTVPSSSALNADLVSGKIVSVNSEYGFVVTNLGANRGIKEGSIFQIYREDKQIGVAQVEKVQTDMSAASIVSADLKARVLENDRVVLVA